MSQANFIEENLNNLGELDRHDFKYLSEHTEQFYLEFSEKEISYIKYLYKLISINDFPNKFNRSNVSIRRIDEKIQFINQFNQRCYEENGEFYITPILNEVDASTIRSISLKIRSNMENKYKWKYRIYKTNNYNICNNFAFNDNCTASIYDNEIITIFNNAYDIKNEDLFKEVVKFGGRKIECYEDDASNYIKAGFMPVAICKWEDSRAPLLWLKQNKIINSNGEYIKDLSKISNDDLFYKRLDIVFFIYTGKVINKSFKDWVKSITYSNNYEEAKELQNRLFKKLMEVT